MKSIVVEEFFRRLEKETPRPKGELKYTNAYTLLVAVALSAQATDISVNKATKKLFRLVKKPEDMLRLGELELREHIKTIGLYNTKAKNLIGMAEALINVHDGRVPDEREALTKLPGVGRKTANVVLNMAYGYPTIAVDTHIFRVSNRTGLAKGKSPVEVERKLLNTTPDQYKAELTCG